MKRKSKIDRLLDAIDAWREIDSDVAANGWTKENEYAWDDARDRMVDLAAALRREMSDSKNILGWCYLSDDSENLENAAYPQFFRTLAKARKTLKSRFAEDCKMFGVGALDKQETCISKDGMSAKLQTFADMRIIRYSITAITFEDNR